MIGWVINDAAICAALIMMPNIHALKHKYAQLPQDFTPFLFNPNFKRLLLNVKGCLVLTKKRGHKTMIKFATATILGLNKG